VNRADRDTEILCGAYWIDARSGSRAVTYSGLGDDPSAYAAEFSHGMCVIGDDQLGSRREGRDHRAMARQELLQRTTDAASPADPRLHRIREDVAENKHRNHHHARALLRVALPILAEVAPVPAAVLAFADGAAGIHHAFRVHKLARQLEGTEEARRILDEIHGKIDELPPERAEALVELLVRDYSG
jgi:hypothetical protein